MQTYQTYLEANRERFLAELIEWLKIPSVSTDESKKDEVRRAAEFLQKKLLEAGDRKSTRLNPVSVSFLSLAD